MISYDIVFAPKSCSMLVAVQRCVVVVVVEVHFPIVLNATLNLSYLPSLGTLSNSTCSELGRVCSHSITIDAWIMLHRLITS